MATLPRRGTDRPHGRPGARSDDPVWIPPSVLRTRRPRLDDHEALSPWPVSPTCQPPLVGGGHTPLGLGGFGHRSASNVAPTVLGGQVPEDTAARAFGPGTFSPAARTPRNSPTFSR